MAEHMTNWRDWLDAFFRPNEHGVSPALAVLILAALFAIGVCA
jgi:hypothetical protein